ncbi:glutaredoxin [Candidatus Poribacteria bacterium]|nr:glutaredoxin [Candidatus Poribacteria bacterium]
MAEHTNAGQPKIVAWMKPSCGWSNGVRAVLAKYGLSYEDRDIINNPQNFFDMVRRTGQRLQPCVLVGEEMLADVSGEELEEWLLDSGTVEPIESDVDVPIDQGCADHADHSEPATFVGR